MAKKPKQVTYTVERVTGDQWQVVARIIVGTFPNQIMAEVVAAAVEDLNIPVVATLPSTARMDSQMPELRPLPLKNGKRKQRSDKGKPRARKPSKARTKALKRAKKSRRGRRS